MKIGGVLSHALEAVQLVTVPLNIFQPLLDFLLKVWLSHKAAIDFLNVLVQLRRIHACVVTRRLGLDLTTQALVITLELLKSFVLVGVLAVPLLVVFQLIVKVGSTFLVGLSKRSSFIDVRATSRSVRKALEIAEHLRMGGFIQGFVIRIVVRSLGRARRGPINTFLLVVLDRLGRQGGLRGFSRGLEHGGACVFCKGCNIAGTRGQRPKGPGHSRN